MTCFDQGNGGRSDFFQIFLRTSTWLTISPFSLCYGDPDGRCCNLTYSPSNSSCNSILRAFCGHWNLLCPYSERIGSVRELTHPFSFSLLRPLEEYLWGLFSTLTSRVPQFDYVPVAFSGSLLDNETFLAFFFSCIASLLFLPRSLGLSPK